MHLCRLQDGRDSGLLPGIGADVTVSELFHTFLDVFSFYVAQWNEQGGEWILAQS